MATLWMRLLRIYYKLSATITVHTSYFLRTKRIDTVSVPAIDFSLILTLTTGNLVCGLRCAFRGGAPLEVTLPLLESLRLGIPKMNVLWEKSAMQKGGRDDQFHNYLGFEKMVRKELEEGKYTLESPVSPPADVAPDWI
jgi:hypothetical protein